MTKKIKIQISRISRDEGKGKKPPKEKEPIIFDDKYKAMEFEKFRVWMALPHIFRGSDELMLDRLGIQDVEVRELLGIKTKVAFGEKFKVSPGTMTIWKNEILAKDYLYQDTKKWVKSVMSNVIGSVYKKSLVEGDANRGKFLATYAGQYIEESKNNNPASDLLNKKIVDFLDRFQGGKK